MKRRIVGLELTGRLDLAARDWTPEDPGIVFDPPYVVAGGAAASVVVTRDRRRVAGPAANVAPHGRGKGWGDIGAAERRRALAGAIDRHGQDSEDAADIRAAVDALARGAGEVIFTVPDLPDFGEAAQGALIRAASGPRRRARLLWRSVAAFLDLLARGDIPKDAVRARYRLLIHGPAGLEDQILTLHADPIHPQHRAPRRDGPGSLKAPEIGLDSLFASASARVQAANPEVAWSRCETSHLGPRLVAGDSEPGDSEILRLQNATWVEIRAPAVDPSDLRLDRIEVAPPDGPVTGTFLVTPLAGRLAGALREALSACLGAVTLVGSETIARGAMRAGRLIERDLPHYFDRLEPISIAILRHDEPAFANLIGPDEVVPANREYVSPALDGFVWGRGKTDAEFYVLKGGAEVRHWEVEQDEAPPRDLPVILRLRQTPGQSWARLSVTSPGWEPLERRPINLDWEALDPQDLTPDQVLNKLRTPPPTIPDLLIERSHLALWTGSIWAGDGAIAHLARHPHGAPVGIWARLLSQPRRDPVTRERFWLVGTEGDVPPNLAPNAIEALDAALANFAATFLAATPRRPLQNNDHARALTWSFRRCPEAVQDRVVAALAAHLAGRSDPILLATAALTVIIQGAGRAVTGALRLRRVLGVLAELPFNNNSINALAMIFTRRIEAPDALSRELVDGFLKMLGDQLYRQVTARSFSVKFRNTLSAIAGLFRWRTREPYALLADRDPVAAELRQTLENARALLSTSAYRQVPQVGQKIEQIQKIVEYLDGGGDPDILRFIEEE